MANQGAVDRIVGRFIPHLRIDTVTAQVMAVGNVHALMSQHTLDLLDSVLLDPCRVVVDSATVSRHRRHVGHLDAKSEQQACVEGVAHDHASLSLLDDLIGVHVTS